MGRKENFGSQPPREQESPKKCNRKSCRGGGSDLHDSAVIVECDNGPTHVRLLNSYLVRVPSGRLAGVLDIGPEDHLVRKEKYI